MVASVSFESGGSLPVSAPVDITAVSDAGFITGQSMSYDAFGRTLSQTDARTGTMTYDGDADGSPDVTDSGNPLYVKDSGNRVTQFIYDVMGRRLTVDAPDTLDAAGNALANITSTSYTVRGQVSATWGDQIYPKFYEYDAQGRMTHLHTYQASPSITQSTLVPPAGSATTQWVYDSQRGWLVEKNYAGESNQGPGNTADYTYTLGGRLHSRNWERGVLTTYAYEQGLLEAIDYSDSTPDIAYTYDAFARIATVNRAGVPHASYAYDPINLVLKQESLNKDLPPIAVNLERRYDQYLRPENNFIDPGNGPIYSATYGYDQAGRLSTVLDQVGDTFTYGYLANSHGMVETVTGPAHTVTNTYEPSRNVLSLKENEVGTALISSYDYTVNHLGQWTQLTTDGSAFNVKPALTWGYNSRGELVETSDSSSSNFDRAYQYDAIGNRQKTVNGLIGDLPTTPNYAANALNQYSTVPGISAAPVHDDDGNATKYPLPVDQSGNATLEWDAENRLIKTTTPGGAVTEFTYDYLSRRITKRSSTEIECYFYDGWNPIIEKTAPAAGGPFTEIRIYTWGKDLSGSIQEAGGVGGLLALERQSDFLSNPSSTESFYPTYGGNGNVSEYLDSSGAVSAHFEYDPFGNTTIDTDTVEKFDIRFSTKKRDTETGLYYYGYRYYDPVTGRWPSRDPLGLNWNTGEFNVYAFVNNFPIKVVDNLGLQIANGNGNKTGDEDKNKVGYEASRAAAELTKKHKDKLEYCGLVCCKKGKYQKTPPVEGTIKTTPIGDSIETKHTCKPHEKGSCEKQLGEGWKTVGWYHSHPDGADNFSDGDFNYTWPYEDDDRDFDGYMGNTDGDVFKLEVTSEEITNEYGTGIVNTGETSSVDENGNEGPSAPSHPRN